MVGGASFGILIGSVVGFIITLTFSISTGFYSIIALTSAIIGGVIGYRLKI